MAIFLWRPPPPGLVSPSSTAASHLAATSHSALCAGKSPQAFEHAHISSQIEMARNAISITHPIAQGVESSGRSGCGLEYGALHLGPWLHVDATLHLRQVNVVPALNHRKGAFYFSGAHCFFLKPYTIGLAVRRSPCRPSNHRLMSRRVGARLTASSFERFAQHVMPAFGD